MAKNYVALFAFLLLICVLTISEFATVKGELCEKASKTWFGNCGNTRHCDDQCKSWEGATHGACHVRNKKHMCFCYFNCPKAEKLAQDKLKAEKLAQDKLKAEALARDKTEPEKVPHHEHPFGPIHHP